MKAPAQPRLYGLMAEFSDPTALVAATRHAHEAGYRHLDAYTPFPIEELSEALGLHRNLLPPIVLAGGITGLLSGLGLQYWTSVIDYPINVGGRPLFSLPSFVPVTFELTILFAAFAAVFGMLALNGLPMPHHPVFGAPRFALASRDRFFLCIEATDPRFDQDETWRFLQRLQPRQISEVER